MKHRAAPLPRSALITSLLAASCGGGTPLSMPDGGSTDAGLTGGSGGSGGSGDGGAGGFKATGGQPGTGGSGTGGSGPGGSGGYAGVGGSGGYGGYFPTGGVGGYGGNWGTGGSGTGGNRATGGVGGNWGTGGSGGYGGTGGYYGTGGIGGYGGGCVCPGGTGGYGGAGPYPYPCYCPPPLPPDPLRDELTDAYCGAGERCCKPEDGFVFGGYCKYDLGQNLTSLLGQVRASQAAGRSVFDEAALKACAQKLKTDACKDIAPLLSGSMLADVPGCPRITMGKVAEGEGCDRDFECLDGLYCDGASCRPRPASGQPCPDGYCGAGLYCRTFNSGPRCVTKEPDGRLCDGPEECASGSCSYNPMYATTLCGPPMQCTGR